MQSPVVQSSVGQSNEANIVNDAKQRKRQHPEDTLPTNVGNYHTSVNQAINNIDNDEQYIPADEEVYIAKRTRIRYGQNTIQSKRAHNDVHNSFPNQLQHDYDQYQRIKTVNDSHSDKDNQDTLSNHNITISRQYHGENCPNEPLKNRNDIQETDAFHFPSSSPTINTLDVQLHPHSPHSRSSPFGLHEGLPNTPNLATLLQFEKQESLDNRLEKKNSSMLSQGLSDSHYQSPRSETELAKTTSQPARIESSNEIVAALEKELRELTNRNAAEFEKYVESQRKTSQNMIQNDLETVPNVIQNDLETVPNVIQNDLETVPKSLQRHDPKATQKHDPNVIQNDMETASTVNITRYHESEMVVGKLNLEHSLKGVEYLEMHVDVETIDQYAEWKRNITIFYSDPLCQLTQVFRLDLDGLEKGSYTFGANQKCNFKVNVDDLGSLWCPDVIGYFVSEGENKNKAFKLAKGFPDSDKIFILQKGWTYFLGKGLSLEVGQDNVFKLYDINRKIYRNFLKCPGDLFYPYNSKLRFKGEFISKGKFQIKFNGQDKVFNTLGTSVLYLDDLCKTQRVFAYRAVDIRQKNGKLYLDFNFSFAVSLPKGITCVNVLEQKVIAGVNSKYF
ncbi:hypothetical protein HK103_002445 [Boothiomyces macroporosus]|uniref:Uncharacterized protein n=1 Tax=Boothiomyces macroporosus TaxID=261099 RepID=A0AAD5Y4D5_9FUNG|nr:hypothetical protein HK103_002445 [Boothiomyces macroporosus]